MSGPRRLNAFTGFAFVNAPTAAAVRASGSCGASFAAASNCRSAETGRSRLQSAEPYRSFARASGFAAARASAASSCAGGSLRDRGRGAEVEHEVRQGRQTGMFSVGCRRSSALTPYGESAPIFAAFSHAATASALRPAQ